MFRNNLYKNNELIYGICNDKKTFENLFKIWPEYYISVINNIDILRTGF